jgi:hypothetical protein
MAWLQLANNAQTVLGGVVSLLATSITPSSKAGFPDPDVDGSFYVTLSDPGFANPTDDSTRETVLVTANDGAAWTVTRAQCGTSAQEHEIADRVSLYLMAEHLEEIEAAVDLNTAARHAAVTVADTTSVDLTLTGQQVSAAVLPAGVDHNALLNYSADRHFLQTAIDHVSTDLATGLLKVATGTGALSSITDSSANWDAAYSHVSASGASHTYIDQDVTTAASPQFAGLDLGTGSLVFGSSDDLYLKYTSHASIATLNLYPSGSSIVNSRYVARCDEALGGIASFTAATNAQITPASTNRPGLINFVITAADPDALKGRVDVYVNTGDLNEIALTLNDNKSADFASYVNAVSGFKDNGTAGIDTTFVDNDGNTITVSGGIITSKTAP